MRAVVIHELSGPESVEVREVDEPDRSHQLSDDVIVIDVVAAGVSFPELLQTRGRYQHAPELPFTPGLEVAGTVKWAPPDSHFSVGDEVMAFTNQGGMAQVAVAPAFTVFSKPSVLSFAEGAACILNLHTAYFAVHTRARISEGETVVVHGAAGGLGTALCSIARLAGGRVIAVVSSEAKAEVAVAAGAHHAVLTDDDWRQRVNDLCPEGVDIVCDPVGGSRLTASLRTLRAQGRYVVLGYTEGAVSEVKTNRLLLNNLDVIGAGWGAYVRKDPAAFRRIGDAVNDLIINAGLRPIVGHRFRLDDAAQALSLLENREAMGKVVLELE